MAGTIVVAGHICLDLIPTIPGPARASLSDWLQPGRLVNVGPAVISTGGAVANTGLALHRLGAPVRLVGKVGADPFGSVVLEVLRGAGAGLADFMVVDPASHTSYTAVVSAPGIDRVFLHHPGANDTFGAADLREHHLDGAALLHVGYPPLMRRLYQDGGGELETIFRRGRAAGLMTSLDMSMPDPASESGRVDWPSLLRRVLPKVDIFLPSLDEAAFMLRLPLAPERWLGNLRTISAWLLDAGVAVVALKLGADGLYLRTSAEPRRLAAIGRGPEWVGRELLAPCFRVGVVGTTGSGDCTIAGFLAEFLEGSSPETVATFATATGGCSVESADATSAVRSRTETLHRVAEGWPKHPAPAAVSHWHFDAGSLVLSDPYSPAESFR